MKLRVLFVGAILALISFIAPLAPAFARVQCYAENYGGGNCGTTCVIYNNVTGNVDGWGTRTYAC